MKDYELDIINNDLIKKIIKALNLNKNQILSGIEVFQQIINEQNSIEPLDFITQVKIYDENNIIGVVVPSGNLKSKMIREKYHKLSNISLLNSEINFSKSKTSSLSNLKNDFFWSLHESPENDRSEIAVWFKNFFKAININKKISRGFYLIGEFGVGKTSFMQAFANYLINKNNTVVFIKISDLTNFLKKLFNDPDNMNKIINTLKDVDYLLIDDIGSEKVSEWMIQDILYPIIDHRSINKKMTCFTSNHDYQSLFKIYLKSGKIDEFNLKRLLDRIKSSTNEIKISGRNVKEFDL